ncbi:hypothetical protein POM88_003649 [Heracleum sosnowskyi]|uniref:Uncharacterized protein n=1 Tax=Heracleum sosnowskyi TaxID=360622 RepID=A0AAD8NBV8_9APIA|nr:hypothetical protein POM88_003649 [Heracleum sosnowskyi]
MRAASASYLEFLINDDEGASNVAINHTDFHNHRKGETTWTSLHETPHPPPPPPPGQANFHTKLITHSPPNPLGFPRVLILNSSQLIDRTVTHSVSSQLGCINI